MIGIGFLGFAFSNLTAVAGTAITALIPPRRGAYTWLRRLLYRCGGTAHTVTAMKAFGVTTLTADVAASGTSITLAADPGSGTGSGNLANGDWLCIELNDGSFFLSALSSLSGLTMTVGALPAAASAGKRVWTFGVPADHASTQTNPRAPGGPANARVGELKGSAFPAAANSLNGWSDVCQSTMQDEPMMVHSNNATNAGTFELVSGHHYLPGEQAT